MRSEHQRSKHFNAFLVVLAIAAVAVALTYGAFGSHAARYVQDHDGEASHGYAELCSGDAGRQLDAGARYVEAYLDLREDQQEAWTRLQSAISRATSKLTEGCDALSAAVPTAPERLARAEKMLVAGSQALNAIGPAFDGFYAVLDEQQRRDLEAMISRHGIH